MRQISQRKLYLSEINLENYIFNELQEFLVMERLTLFLSTSSVDPNKSNVFHLEKPQNCWGSKALIIKKKQSLDKK